MGAFAGTLRGQSLRGEGRIDHDERQDFVPQRFAPTALSPAEAAVCPVGMAEPVVSKRNARKAFERLTGMRVMIRKTVFS